MPSNIRVISLFNTHTPLRVLPVYWYHNYHYHHYLESDPAADRLFLFRLPSKDAGGLEGNSRSNVVLWRIAIRFFYSKAPIIIYYFHERFWKGYIAID